jgi:hypothetical protein
MKHVKLLMCLMVMMLLAVSCDDDKIIPAEQLPAAAKTYLQQNQPGTNILFVKKDRELFSTKYKVQLDNRMEIEFDGDGMPIDMDMDD